MPQKSASAVDLATLTRISANGGRAVGMGMARCPSSGAIDLGVSALCHIPNAVLGANHAVVGLLPQSPMYGCTLRVLKKCMMYIHTNQTAT
jgi:hypothetical protein